MSESSKVTPSPNVAVVGAGGVVVNAAAPALPSVLWEGLIIGTAEVPATPDPRVKKVIVAVHGVGDQYSYATLQSVVNQFCSFYGQPSAMPLGSFHTGQVAFSIHPPYPQDPFERLAFSEVYWAKIPRAVVDDKHTMEESKKWAVTIVERLRMRWKTTGSKGGCRDADFDLVKLVLGEMIQTLAVLERLCYIADRAGVFTFDLRKLLDDYLGDVQIVAEFGTERLKILKAFDTVMTRVHKAYPSAEIFIIAHSEGTVVSLLGITQAGLAQQTPDWLERVRGFMTIGSPIDKHMILWPELFPATPPTWTPPNDKTKIEWRNYYDRADPIGFSLDDARMWLTACQWDKVFNFSVSDDFGFDRYPFPGKAHVDYWTDPAVFGHFIETVVKEPLLDCDTQPGAAFTKPPGDIKWKKRLSYVVPYLGVAAILFIGVFILYKAVMAAIDPGEVTRQSTTVMLRSVACTTTLLLGITITPRLHRLANTRFWQVGAFIAWVFFVASYALLLRSGPTVSVLRQWKAAGIPLRESTATDIPVDFIVALGLGLVVWLVTKLRPSWGLKPLILLGTSLIALVVGQNLYTAKYVHDIGPIWPVFLATVAFLYLWWLSALTFDLVFVWHLHIRQAKALERLDEIIGTPWGRARCAK
jgi:hypothetical protein